MTHAAPSPGTAATTGRWRARLPALAILAAAVAAYANSLDGPLVFDDLPAIRDNPTLGSLSAALAPPSSDGNTAGGRPLLNLSFALNRALGGDAVRGYHALNLLIHAVASLLLFALLRRILAHRSPALAAPVAFTTALLWSVHPLTTAAVTYLVQRAESLAALWILLALYGFVRSAGSGRAWLAVSAAAALAGVATKETAVVAPLLVLLLDRTLVAGTFVGALRARPAYYGALAASWVALAFLALSTGARGGTVGAEGPITAANYLATQCRAIVHYLRLAVWPDPLVFDYGSPIVRWSAAWPFAVALVLAGATAAIAVLRRRSIAGLAGATFLLLLAPSSSFLPITTQTMAEHRFYLPLAVVIALLVAVAARWGGRRGLILAVALALPLGWATHRRNEVYRSAESLWADTIAKRPDNPRAHNNLGLVLAESGRNREALAHFETAVGLVPENPEALNNLGNVLRRLGRPADAVTHYREAIRLRPASALIQINFATALFQSGRPAEAATAFAEATRLGLLDPESHVNYGAALLAAGRPAEAVTVLEAARRGTAGPLAARAHYNLGNAWATLSNWTEAVAGYRAALTAQPDHLPAQANLGNALLVSGQPAEAAAAFEQALRLRPGDARLQASLARARALAAERP